MNLDLLPSSETGNPELLPLFSVVKSAGLVPVSLSSVVDEVPLPFWFCSCCCWLLSTEFRLGGRLVLESPLVGPNKDK